MSHDVALLVVGALAGFVPCFVVSMIFIVRQAAEINRLSRWINRLER